MTVLVYWAVEALVLGVAALAGAWAANVAHRDRWDRQADNTWEAGYAEGWRRRGLYSGTMIPTVGPLAGGRHRPRWQATTPGPHAAAFRSQPGSAAAPGDDTVRLNIIP